MSTEMISVNIKMSLRFVRIKSFFLLHDFLTLNRGLTICLKLGAGCIIKAQKLGAQNLQFLY